MDRKQELMNIINDVNIVNIIALYDFKRRTYDRFFNKLISKSTSLDTFDIIQEWEPYDVIDTYNFGIFKCICGVPVRHVHKYENYKTGDTVIIGSTCSENFLMDKKNMLCELKNKNKCENHNVNLLYDNKRKKRVCPLCYFFKHCDDIIYVNTKNIDKDFLHIITYDKSWVRWVRTNKMTSKNLKKFKIFVRYYKLILKNKRLIHKFKILCIEKNKKSKFCKKFNIEELIP